MFTARRTYAMRKRGVCSRPVSVRPSVRPSARHVRVLYPDGWRHRRSSFSAWWLHHSSVFFDSVRWYPIPRGNPISGSAKTRRWESFAIFDWNHRLSRKRYTNRKPYLTHWMVPCLVTLTGL